MNFVNCQSYSSNTRTFQIVRASLRNMREINSTTPSTDVCSHGHQIRNVASHYKQQYETVGTQTHGPVPDASIPSDKAENEKSVSGSWKETLLLRLLAKLGNEKFFSHFWVLETTWNTLLKVNLPSGILNIYHQIQLQNMGQHLGGLYSSKTELAILQVLF